MYFPANVYVSLYFDVVDDMHKLGTVKASSTGTFAFSFDVMEGYTGTHRVVAKVVSSGIEYQGSFNILNTRPMDERLVNFLNSIYVNLTTQIDNYFNSTSGTFYTFVNDWFTWIYGNLTVMNNTLNQVNTTVNYINGTVNTINGTVNTINTTVTTINTTVTDIQNTTNFVWTWVQQIENKLDANGINLAGDFNRSVINWFNWIYGNLSSVGDTVNQINTTVNYINGTVNAMNTTVNHIDGVVVFMNGTVGYINNTVNVINNTVNVINGTVSTISTTVNQINGTVNAMNTTVNYINGNVSSIYWTVDQISTTVDEMELKLDNNFINVAGNFFTWLFGNLTGMNNTINTINTSLAPGGAFNLFASSWFSSLYSNITAVNSSLLSQIQSTNSSIHDALDDLPCLPSTRIETGYINTTGLTSPYTVYDSMDENINARLTISIGAMNVNTSEWVRMNYYLDCSFGFIGIDYVTEIPGDNDDSATFQYVTTKLDITWNGDVIIYYKLFIEELP